MRPQYKHLFPYPESACFLTIDPGNRENGGCGLGFFSNLVQPELIQSMQINAKGSNWEERNDTIIESINKILLQYCDLLQAVIVEQPRYFDSYKGHTSANTNSLFKLINTYSRIEQIIKTNKLKFFPIPVIKWKGQLTKERTLFRLKRICGENFNPKWKIDELDAIALGYHVLGKF